MIGPVPLPFVLEALALGYLLGSIPFGLFFAFASGAGDVRKIGSGNIGATNVLRTGKKWAAAATLLCDGLKGAASVLLASILLPPGSEIFAALAAVLGHIFPVWLGFKGGKAGRKSRLAGRDEVPAPFFQLLQFAHSFVFWRQDEAFAAAALRKPRQFPQRVLGAAETRDQLGKGDGPHGIGARKPQPCQLFRRVQGAGHCVLAPLEPMRGSSPRSSRRIFSRCMKKIIAARTRARGA